MPDAAALAPVNPIDLASKYQKSFFPFAAFAADDPNTTPDPTLTIISPWQFAGIGKKLVTVYADTAANLASANPVMLAGQIGYETDTLSFKIGDGSTAYNSLTYAYRGLPVAGEPSLGTDHPAPVDGSGNAYSVYSGTPNTRPSSTSIDFSNLVPVGTKSVRCTGSMKVESNLTTALFIGTPSTHGGYGGGAVQAQGYGGAAFQLFPILIDILLDSDLKGYISKPNANLIEVDLFLSRYTI